MDIKLKGCKQWYSAKYRLEDVRKERLSLQYYVILVNLSFSDTVIDVWERYHIDISCVA